MIDPTPPPRRRRWFTLSLRGLMLMILVVGIPMGWKARRASLQRRAVAKIEQIQGDVVYDWQPSDPFATPAVPPEPHGPIWLRRMIGDEYFQEVVAVTIPGFRRGLGPPPPSPDEPIDSPRWKAFSENVRRNQEAEEALARDELACLEGLDRIESLTLYRPPLNSEGLARLGRLTSLKELTISWPLSAQGLAEVSKLSNLERLYSQFELGDDPSLALLERLPRLSKLSLHSQGRSIVFKINDTSLARLGKLKHLTSLDLDALELTDAGMLHLKGLTHLEVLGLEGLTWITDVGLGHLKENTSLKTLLLGGATGIGDEGLAYLKGLKDLEHLNLSSASGVTDAGLSHLVGLKELYWLEIDSASRVTDAGIEQLVRMPQLVGLDLNVKSVTDAGLDRLKSLTKLRGLDLTGRKIKGEILDGIQAAIPGVSISAERIDDPEAPSPSDAITPPPAVPRN